MKARKKISSLILLMFSGFSFASMTDDQVKQGLATVAEQLPIRMDSFTTVNTIILLPGKDIMYRYSFDFDKAIGLAAKEKNLTTDDIIKSALATFGTVDRWLKEWGDQYIYPTIRNGNCSTPGPKKFVESGFSLSHEFYDTHGNFLYQMKITKEVCGKIN